MEITGLTGQRGPSYLLYTLSSRIRKIRCQAKDVTIEVCDQGNTLLSLDRNTVHFTANLITAATVDILTHVATTLYPKASGKDETSSHGRFLVRRVEIIQA